MTQPRYARFRKADLQMQMPVDRAHWTGAPLDDGGCGLPHGASDEQIDESAKRYAERCREVGLEIVGLTDHNLGGRDAERFHDGLVRHLGGGVTVFPPGFEVEISPGVHFLCLFEPDTPFESLKHALSRLGLTPGRHEGGATAASAESFSDLIRIVEQECHGQVIAAHAISARGVCDDTTVAQRWTHDLVNDRRLLCVELPKYRPCYEDPARAGKVGKLVRGEDGWGIERGAIAVINSSDCKRLRPSERRGTSQTEGYIGKRATWLKMDRVTIAGLRQAFLDHESRIAFPERPRTRTRRRRIAGPSRRASSGSRSAT